jgi:hypothetical protein
MKGSRFLKDLVPSHLAWLDFRHGGIGPIIEDRAGPRACPEFHKIKPNAVFFGPNDVGKVNTVLPSFVGNHATQGVIGEASYISTAKAQPLRSHGYVQFSPADVNI